MRNRVTWYWVLLLAFGLLGASCAPSAAPPGPTTLEFWGGWTGPDAEVMKEIVGEWNADHPDAQVNLTLQPWSQTYDQFLVSASSHSAPDILAMHPPEMEQFSALGLLLPLDEVVADTAIRAEAYNPTVWAANQVGGRLYGIPLDQQMYGLYYNTDLAKAAGVTIPSEPMTAAQYLDVLRRLTVDAHGRHPGEAGFDAGDVAHYGVNMFTNHHAFYQWWGLYNQFADVTFFSADGKSCAWDLDKAARAWQFLQDLVYVQQVAPQGQTDYARDFLTGRTAMLVDGPWRRPQLVTAAQEQAFTGRWRLTRRFLIGAVSGRAAIP